MENNPHARQNGETTAQWLERLVNLNAPQHVIDAVRQILAQETHGKFLLYFRKNFALFLQVRLLVNVMKVFRSLFLFIYLMTF